MTAVTPTELPTDVAALRAQLTQLQSTAAAQQTQLRQLQMELLAAERSHNAALAKQLSAQIAALGAQRTATAAQITSLLAQLTAKGYPPEPTGAQIESLAANVPAALLPVRLETRWVKGATGAELWIRIFPDQIHSDTHEPELTAEELSWGQHFWEMRWCAGGAADAQAEAWRQLAARFGPARGAWVARALRPLNPQSAPTAPVADPTLLSPPPQFPTPAARAAAWTRGAIARLLPERFLAIGYQGSLRACAAWGQPVPADLVTGPTPGGPTTTVDGLLIDTDLQWLVDFDTACQVGMGIKLTLPAGTTKLDRLIVLGARPSEAPADGATGLTSLLTAHTYTDGFALIGPGTATNNGATSPSGLNPPADAPAPNQWLTADPHSPAPSPVSEGARLALALGVSPDAMIDIDGAASQREPATQAMLLALWPATGDYYLRQLLAGVATDAQLAALEAWTFANVRPGGPLPAIRIGTQPYGVIAAGSLDTWAAAPGTANAAVIKVLVAAKGIWRSSANGVPRAGGPSGAVDELLGVLSMDALSTSYAARPWVGPNYLDVMEQVSQDPTITGKRGAALSELHSSLQASQGPVPAGPPLVNGMFADHSALLQVPVADRDGPLPRRLVPPGDYLRWLLSSGWQEIVNEHRVTPAPQYPADFDQNDFPRFPLLFYLLRVSVLIEAARAANALIGGSPDALTDPELVDVQSTTPSPARVLATIRAGKTAGDLVWGPAMQQPPTPRIRALSGSLARLESLPAADLDRLTREVLDLCSHRLDAWIGSLAWQRLAATRGAATAGLNVGAYGWLESLSPATPGGATLPNPAPVTPTGSAGWIHAPSLPQATTAAILRGGERAHAGQATGRLLEIDLSSRRARQAEWLLDGVRAGNPLSALLGYRFERLLQESANAALPGFIPAFRQVFPAVAGKLLQAGGDTPNAAPCVDGLALLRAQQAGTMWNAIVTADPSASGAQTDLTAAVTELAALADAVSDAVTAESVHHAALGNPARVAGSLEALDRGEAPPPELTFVRSPQAGVAMTQRVGVLRAAGADPTAGVPGWPAAASLPTRAGGEPVLSAIVGGLLPAPGRVRFTIDLPRPTAPVVTLPVLPRPVVGTPVVGPPRPPVPIPIPVRPAPRFTLADLGVGPLDVLYGSAGANGLSGSELEQRIQAHAQTLHPGLAGVTVDFARKPDWSADDISVPELAELTAALREAFAAARPIVPDDLLGTATPTTVAVDGAAVLGRAQASQAVLTTALDALDAAIAAGSADDQSVLGLLAPLAAFGLSETLLASGGGPLIEQAARIATAAHARQDAATAAIASGATATVPADIAAAGEAALKALFGSGYIVLAPFVPDQSTDANNVALAPDLSRTAQLVSGEPADVAETFLAGAVGVQRALERWQDARLLADALRPLADRGSTTPLVVAQTPADPSGSERWAALQGADDAPPPGGRTSWVLDTTLTALTGEVAGLLIDQWVDVVPQLMQSTGVALHYLAPASQPPQAILVAVPPDDRPNWTVEALERVIVETLDLAHVRAVDLDSLRTVGHIVPGLFLATNPNGDTISTSLTAATRPIAPRPVAS
jgi:hypothetical protein